MIKKNKGILFILASSLFFALMATSVKSAPNIPQVEKIFFRNFIGLIVISFSLYKNKTPLKPNNIKLMSLRSIFGLFGVALYYNSLAHLKLSDAVIINKLSPFFVLILSVIFLKEKITKYKLISLVLAVTGAILVLKPSFDYTFLPALSGLFGAFFAGSAYTTIRKLTKYDKAKLIVFYFCLFSSVVMFPLMLMGNFKIPTLFEFISLISIGVSALIAQLFMTNAYKYAPASELAIYSNANIVFSTLIGLIFWSEIPDIYSIIGVFIIVFAVYVNTKNK
ncbi:DMT family transporter [Helicovermis profundi]|uniref:DMT family transporter n=1 Tax=Helicovermis profundi TaxID=3065157 RepID=A0AAU9E8T8_9FIRM|nr:DMT family transporter [Clostridia bacterium S502]